MMWLFQFPYITERDVTTVTLIFVIKVLHKSSLCVSLKRKLTWTPVFSPFLVYNSDLCWKFGTWPFQDYVNDSIFCDLLPVLLSVPTFMSRSVLNFTDTLYANSHCSPRTKKYRLSIGCLPTRSFRFLIKNHNLRWRLLSSMLDLI